MNYQEVLKNGTMAKNYERFDEALDWFAKAIELDDSQPQAYFYRANIYNHSLKEYDKALELLNELIEIGEYNDKLIAQRAEVYLILGKKQEALQDITRALNIDNENPKLMELRETIILSLNKEENT